jgi:hypothetical protein
MLLIIMKSTIIIEKLRDGNVRHRHAAAEELVDSETMRESDVVALLRKGLAVEAPVYVQEEYVRAQQAGQPPAAVIQRTHAASSAFGLQPADHAEARIPPQFRGGLAAQRG